MNDTATANAPARDSVAARSTGSAYGMRPGKSDDRLTQTGPGTPMGELMRRYWQPIAASADVTQRPQRVRIMSEDLVLFRNKAGQAGLLHSRCMHRGTDLFFGRVEEEGIRCCYHGWLFGVEGQCLDQPCEPEGGVHRNRFRQPWYPVEERYGLVFAYMGPPEKKPVLPRYELLENVGPDEFLEIEATSYFVRFESGLDPALPYNWLQQFENVVDPYHTYILHSHMSGIQLAPRFAILPQAQFARVPGGVASWSVRPFEDGRRLRTSACCMIPNISAIPHIGEEAINAAGLSWHLPIDDENSRAFIVMKNKVALFTRAPMYGGKSFSERSTTEAQDFPGDFEAQFGQGVINLHSEEHLTTSDKGIVLLRQYLKEQTKVVENGGDPDGLIFDPDDDLVKLSAGNWYE